MSQEFKEGKTHLSEFEYGRNLYIHLFQDDTPFVNLGYPPSLRALAKKALYPLQDEVSMGPGPRPNLYFEGENEEWGTIYLLKHGGYILRAAVELPRYDFSTSFSEREKLEAEFTFFESEGHGYVAFIDMIPEDVNYEDLNRLVPHLYEGTEIWSSSNVSLELSNQLSRLKSHLFSEVSTFRAVWIDEGTKLDLVVETDFSDKDDQVRNPQKYIDVWRRLPIIELDGKGWIPFGKKPNISRKSAQQAFEKQKGKVVVGNLVQQADKE